MVSIVRKEFNNEFTQEKYQAMQREIALRYPNAMDFRLAETPVFIPKNLLTQMLRACDSIIDFIIDPSFNTLTERAIPVKEKVAGHYGRPETLVFDFGICDSPDGILPMLVEMQGFPSLYGFQNFYPDILKKHFNIPSGFTHYIGGLDHASYSELLKKVILGDHKPENVILLEIEPHKQKTRIDFYCTRDMTGIQPVCITELRKEGKKLFYTLNGIKTPVHRIYNRVIFDELNSRKDLGEIVDIREEYDVEWLPHPDWFYRVSKFTLPFISHLNVPETFFLNEIKDLPGKLDEFVLKPLFSFAGQGVIIDIQAEDINNIADPENWILQKKVHYADIIYTPDGMAKTEIRIMYLWEKGESRPRPVINLARISKGKMIGTRYNKDRTWVGGSVAFFET